MKAVVASGGVWSVRSRPDPEPEPHQVLIRVRASGVCRNDLTQQSGTPGHEPAGEVVAVGAAVRSRRVGDRVGVMLWQSSCKRCPACRHGREIDCRELVGTSLHLPGSHAEYMVTDADGTVPLPDGLPFEQAAPVFCAGYTALAGLRAGNPQPGERVAVLGVGGLGHMAIQYARVSGFHTIAVSRRPDKDELIRALGADEIVRGGHDLARAGGADVVLATSPDMAAQAEVLDGLRPEGRLVVMGMGAEPLTIPVGPLVVNRLKVIGSQHNGREHLVDALRLAAEGAVRAITETYELGDAATARARFENGLVRMRAILLT